LAPAPLSTHVSVDGSFPDCGPYSLNVTVPVAFPVAPLIVAVSLIGLPTITEAVALVVNDEQFVTVIAWGATKSFSAALNESDERLFRYALPRL